MTLNANDKVEIYHLKQLGWTWPQLSQKFDVNKAHLQYREKQLLFTRIERENHQRSPIKRSFSTRRFTGLCTAK